jgi:hypothetical protein
MFSFPTAHLITAHGHLPTAPCTPFRATFPCTLFTFHCLLHLIHFSLSTAYCTLLPAPFRPIAAVPAPTPLFIAHCPLPTVYCTMLPAPFSRIIAVPAPTPPLLFIAHCPLPTAYCTMLPAPFRPTAALLALLTLCLLLPTSSSLK